MALNEADKAKMRAYAREMRELSKRYNNGEVFDAETTKRIKRHQASLKRAYKKKNEKEKLENAKRRQERVKAKTQHEKLIEAKQNASEPDEIPLPPEPKKQAPPPPPVPVAVPFVHIGGTMTDRQKLKLRELILEARDRKYETLKLYRPMPIQAEFHMSDAHIRILRGGNRSGKTSATMVELAWALTNSHPQRDKYPATDGRAIVVAKDVDKIGEVIWRALGRPGAFKMVDDPETGEPRIERPGDREAKLKMRAAPPLIPKRMIENIGWVSAKMGQPKKLVCKTGWECSFYSSNADPFSIQGTKLDLVVFDEEIEHEDWFPEAIARLVDRGGRFVWGATPQTGTQKLYDLYLKAMEDEELKVERPLVEEFVLSIWNNPFISEQDRQLFLASLDDEDQIKIRIEGEHAVAGFKIFGPYFFPRGIHAQEPFPIPSDWTRFAAIDPGVQVAAVLFAAVPPRERPKGCDLSEDLFGDFIYIYDEIHIKRCDATRLATAMRDHVGDQHLHTILIDHHGGNLTEIGSGKTPEQQYRDAFKAAKVPVPQVGRYFTYGSDDLQGGILKVKDALRLREDGTPRLKVFSGACPQLVAAMSRYQWKVTNGIMTDKPLAKNCDTVDALRYIVMHPGLRYQKIIEKEKKKKTCYDQFLEWKKRERQHKDGPKGPGITL